MRDVFQTFVVSRNTDLRRVPSTESTYALLVPKYGSEYMLLHVCFSKLYFAFPTLLSTSLHCSINKLEDGIPFVMMHSYLFRRSFISLSFHFSHSCISRRIKPHIQALVVLLSEPGSVLVQSRLITIYSS